MITLLNGNMSWYLQNGFVTVEAAKNLAAKKDQAVKDLLPHVNDCIEGLGLIMTPEVNGPISRDYI
jgi:hypothetical protein